MPAPARRTSTVWFIGAATAFSLLGDQALYSTLPIFFEELGLRPFQVGIILSANRWIRMATNELAHRLTDAADQRLMFVSALGLGAATTAIYAATLDSPSSWPPGRPGVCAGPSFGTSGC